MMLIPVRKIPALCLSLVLCVTPFAAQDGPKKSGKQPPPDLSGTWVLDTQEGRNDKSKSRRQPQRQITLVIAHHEPEIKFIRKEIVDGRESALEMVYYADGRGEKNQSYLIREMSLPFLVSGMVESETKWKANRLFTRGTLYLRANGDVNDVEFSEDWKLSADGETLTLTTSFYPDRMPERSRIGDSYTRVIPADSRRVFRRVR